MVGRGLRQTRSYGTNVFDKSRRRRTINAPKTTRAAGFFDEFARGDFSSSIVALSDWIKSAGVRRCDCVRMAARTPRSHHRMGCVEFHCQWHWHRAAKIFARALLTARTTQFEIILFLFALLTFTAVINRAVNNQSQMLALFQWKSLLLGCKKKVRGNKILYLWHGANQHYCFWIYLYFLVKGSFNYYNLLT